jgi:hypothetical protein
LGDTIAKTIATEGFESINDALKREIDTISRLSENKESQ